MEKRLLDTDKATSDKDYGLIWYPCCLSKTHLRYSFGAAVLNAPITYTLLWSISSLSGRLHLTTQILDERIPWSYPFQILEMIVELIRIEHSGSFIVGGKF